MFDWLVFLIKWFIRGFKNIKRFFWVIWNYDYSVENSLLLLKIADKDNQMKSLNEIAKILISTQCLEEANKIYGKPVIGFDGKVDYSFIINEDLRFEMITKCKKQDWYILDYHLEQFCKELHENLKRKYLL